jgi:hypothetical protein
VVRPIFFALLLANLFYMGWAEWIDVPAPPPPSSTAGLPRLKLVSDLSPDKRAALASKASLQTPPSQCVSVGPFDDPAIATQAAALLRAKSFAPQQRAAESPTVRRFWVHLDGFTSDAAEMRVLHRLERAGIDDAEAMPVAAGGRRVSLGLFNDRDRAERRVKAVTAVGFKPAVTERMLPGTVYWLDLTLAGGSTPVPLKDVSDLEPGGGSSPISVQPCASAPSPAAPSPQTESPASSPVTPPAPAPRATPPTSAPASATTLPRCKPGGGGTVPCVVLHVVTQPSVL